MTDGFTTMADPPRGDTAAPSKNVDCAVPMVLTLFVVRSMCLGNFPPYSANTAKRGYEVLQSALHPAGLLVPVGHEMQFDASATALYFPEGQARHVPDVTLSSIPALQVPACTFLHSKTETEKRKHTTSLPMLHGSRAPHLYHQTRPN